MEGVRMCHKCEEEGNRSPCDGFVANQWRPARCSVCSHDAFSHEGTTPEEQAQAVLSKDDSKPCKIVDYLYMGGMKAAVNKTALQAEKVTHIVNCAKGIDKVWPNFKQDTNTFTYLNLDLDDSHDQGIVTQLRRCVPWISQRIADGAGVFVHCAQGVSRSGAVVIAYLMKHNQWSFEEALAVARKGRVCCQPNASFVAQLREWEADGMPVDEGEE